MRMMNDGVEDDDGDDYNLIWMLMNVPILMAMIMMMMMMTLIIIHHQHCQHI